MKYSDIKKNELIEEFKEYHKNLPGLTYLSFDTFYSPTLDHIWFRTCVNIAGQSYGFDTMEELIDFLGKETLHRELISRKF